MVAEIELMLRLLLATGLGGIIGLERESVHEPAGLRTHTLISLAACLITITSIEYFTLPGTDTSRIAAGIVLGVGFIGAGAIMNRREDVKGITTAASIWIVAALGLSVGAGNYLLSIVTGVIVFFVLRIGKYEKKVFKK
ncbi:MAG: MgtC/SapB family protein [Candidatus Aenigmarchaeota archaeon]|nr:MgtC/SapB family protein [Candidatus Aenigmarchaeota archaeon]